MGNLGLHQFSVRVRQVRIASGWYNDDGVFVGLLCKHAPVRCFVLPPPNRAQARSCRVDRARTKRRRFTQRLRRGASC